MTSDELQEAANVMLAAASGKAIECRHRGDKEWRVVLETSKFNWDEWEFRVKPKSLEVWVAIYTDEIGPPRIGSAFISEYFARHYHPNALRYIRCVEAAP